MANVNKPFGLRPLGNLSATGAQKQYGYQIADNQAGAIYQGDLVVVYDGYIIKYDASTHAAPTGVFMVANTTIPHVLTSPHGRTTIPVASTSLQASLLAK